MSDEISTTDSLNLIKGEIKNKGFKYNSIKIDQTGNGYVAGEMDLTVTPQAIPMGDLVLPGRYGIKCTIGATGNVQIGTMDSVGFIPLDELPLGEPSSGRWATTQPYARMSVGTGKIDYFTAEA